MRSRSGPHDARRKYTLNVRAGKRLRVTSALKEEALGCGVCVLATFWISQDRCDAGYRRTAGIYLP
jgi:hypothetical protein